MRDPLRGLDDMGELLFRDAIPRGFKKSPTPGARGILSFKIPRLGVPRGI